MERLKQYLTDHELTQSEFAKRLRVSQPTVSDWLSGECTPTPGKLREISAETGLSIDELLANERSSSRSRRSGPRATAA